MHFLGTFQTTLPIFCTSPKFIWQHYENLEPSSHSFFIRYFCYFFSIYLILTNVLQPIFSPTPDIVLFNPHKTLTYFSFLRSSFSSDLVF